MRIRRNIRRGFKRLNFKKPTYDKEITRNKFDCLLLIIVFSGIDVKITTITDRPHRKNKLTDNVT